MGSGVREYHRAPHTPPRGDGAELKRLAAEIVPIFASRDVHPEALAALALFQKAAAAEQVDRALLDRNASEPQRTAKPSR